MRGTESEQRQKLWKARISESCLREYVFSLANMGVLSEQEL